MRRHPGFIKLTRFETPPDGEWLSSEEVRRADPSQAVLDGAARLTLGELSHLFIDTVGSFEVTAPRYHPPSQDVIDRAGPALIKFFEKLGGVEENPKDRCECTDPGCPIHYGVSKCSKRGHETLYRVDMEDQHGTLFCEGCTGDAFESGLFSDQEKNPPNWPEGVKVIYGFGGTEKSGVQSLLFDKSAWTPTKAKRWLESHGFKSAKLDAGGPKATYYRFRQISPASFSRMRTSNPGSGRPSRELQRFVDRLRLSRKEPDIRYITQIPEDTPGLELLESLSVHDWNDLWQRPDLHRMLQDFDNAGEFPELPQIFIMHVSLRTQSGMNDVFILVDTQGYDYPRYMGILSKGARRR